MAAKMAEGVQRGLILRFVIFHFRDYDKEKKVALRSCIYISFLGYLMAVLIEVEAGLGGREKNACFFQNQTLPIRPLTGHFTD
jgi:hypothetical protein